MATALINGIGIGYDDEGDGVPLVLIHGHPFDRSMWAPQVREFSDVGWRVIVPDLRGYGESVGSGARTWDAFARDIDALLDHLQVAQVVLGGVSMGGQVVMEFYRLFSQRVRALVLSGTFCHAENEEGRKARHDQADRLLREGMRGYAEEALPKMVAPYNITAQPAVAGHVLTMMLRASADGAAAALRARADRPDYTDLLAGAPVPTLIIVGTDDQFAPVSVAESMVRLMPGATLAVIERAAHLPNLERQSEFNQVLRHFLVAHGVGV